MVGNKVNALSEENTYWINSNIEDVYVSDPSDSVDIQSNNLPESR